MSNIYFRIVKVHSKKCLVTSSMTIVANKLKWNSLSLIHFTMSVVASDFRHLIISRLVTTAFLRWWRYVVMISGSDAMLTFLSYARQFLSRVKTGFYPYWECHYSGLRRQSVATRWSYARPRKAIHDLSEIPGEFPLELGSKKSLSR